MHHKSKQRRQKAWDDGVAPGVRYQPHFCIGPYYEANSLFSTKVGLNFLSSEDHGH